MTELDIVLIILLGILILICIWTGCACYYIGYKRGFNRCKDIDDAIIDEIVNKLNGGK